MDYLLRVAEILNRAESKELIFEIQQDNCGAWYASARVKGAEALGRYILSRSRSTRAARRWRDLNCCIRFLQHKFSGSKILICEKGA